MEGPAAFAASCDVSRETLERLAVFANLICKWSPRINLVAPSTLGDIWGRHFMDSAQLLDFAPKAASGWCDLGAGAGFPGLVIAILAMERTPDLRLMLIESDQRKAAFLRTVLRETGASAGVVVGRIEAAPPAAAAIVSARALAPLPVLLGYAERHLKPGGVGVFPKGTQYKDELADALELWRFRCETLQSQTDPAAVILKISELTRA